LQEQADELAERDHAVVSHWVAGARVCAAEGCSIALPRHETLTPPLHSAEHAKKSVFVCLMKICWGRLVLQFLLLLLLLLLLLRSVCPGVLQGCKSRLLNLWRKVKRRASHAAPLVCG
jgi:hypothetical protein